MYAMAPEEAAEIKGKYRRLHLSIIAAKERTCPEKGMETGPSRK